MQVVGKRKGVQHKTKGVLGKWDEANMNKSVHESNHMGLDPKPYKPKC